MKSFARLFQQIDQTNSTNEKVHFMQKYFSAQSPETSAWALYFLIGRRPKRLISSRLLRKWLGEISGLPDWLLDESYAAVGDTAELVALIMGDMSRESNPLSEASLSTWMNQLIFPLGREDEETQKQTVVSWWHKLSTP